MILNVFQAYRIFSAARGLSSAARGLSAAGGGYSWAARGLSAAEGGYSWAARSGFNRAWPWIQGNPPTGSVGIRIEVLGVPECQEFLAAIPPKLQRDVMRDMAQIVYNTALNDISRHTKTGALRQSLYNRAIPGGREIGNDPDRAPHAVFVHWGTRPHDIRPKEKKALRWAGPGGFVFAKFVRHPGYKGDAYMAKAAREAVRRMSEIVARHLR